MTSSGTANAPVHAYPLSTRVALEGLGSFFIVFAGLGTALFSSGGSGATVGFAYGLAMVAAIISFGHVTNGYFNPAFSLGMAVAGRLKFSAALLYIVAQTIGGILAAAVWLAMMRVMPAGATPAMPELFGALANGFDAHSPSQVPMIGVLIIEMVAVAVLTAMLLGATSPRNKTTMGPVAIGLAFAVAVAITMPLSNGLLNPARATSVVFLADSWALGQLWLFWVAPLVGAALAAVIYRYFAPVRTVDVPVRDASSSALLSSGAVLTQAHPESTVEGATEGVTLVKGRTIAGVEESDDAQAFFDAPQK